MRMATWVAGIALAGLAGGARADSYAIQFVQSRNPENSGQYRVAQVEAKLTPIDGQVGLFRNAEDTGLTHGWATFVHDAHAFAPDGHELPMAYQGAGRWRLGGWTVDEVTLKYRVLLQHDRFPNDPGYDELAYARAYGVMWTGRALMMEGRPARNIAVSFEMPAEWTAVTPWAADDGSGRHFHAASTDELLESAFFAGRPIVRTLAVAGGEARLALGPPLAAIEPSLTARLTASLAAYSRLMGAPMDGRMLAIVSDASFSGGGVMGRSISMLVGNDRGPPEQQAEYVIAHEAFHIWNARWRNRETSGDLQWLSEGAAEYYTNLVAVRSGRMSEAAFIDELARRAGTYLTALRTNSIAQAGAAKLSSQASYDGVYSGGMMALFTLDAQIREASRGRRSLDDAMRVFNTRFAGPGDAAATFVEVGRTLEQDFGAPTATLQRQIAGREALPLAAAFAHYGVTMSVKEGPDAVIVAVVRDPRATARRTAAWRAYLSPPA